MMDLVKFYENYFIDYKHEFLEKGECDLSYFEAEFPNTSYSMNIFIETFENIFPNANHEFEKYKIYLEGLETMMQVESFRCSDFHMDIVDTIREAALEELAELISNYPSRSENNTFNFVDYIEDLNEELGFVGANSEVIQEKYYSNNNEYHSYINVVIEGNHFTTLQIILQNEDLEKYLKNKDLETFILESYEAAIVDFDVDEVFDELYDALSKQYRASEFLKMLKEDEMFFTNTIRDAIHFKMKGR